MKIYQNILELVGNTPLLECGRLQKQLELKATLLAKLEMANPSSSVKDRIATNMLLQAIRAGLVQKDTQIIEPTSGNTGIGLAMAGAALGYSITLVMSEAMSMERRKMMTAYGAKLVLTDPTKGTKGAIEKAKELAAQTKNSFMPFQFENPDNPSTHYQTTGPEIWTDTDGEVDIFIAGVGTGGSISGIGKYLKEKNLEIKIIAVEPKDSAVLSGNPPGPHGIQGIGAGFIPKTMNTSIVDEIIQVELSDAMDCTRLLARNEGVLTGISGGAALYASIQVAKRPENMGKKIVFILPDTGERYLSTNLFT
jgi:cysteine synthase A